MNLGVTGSHGPCQQLRPAVAPSHDHACTLIVHAQSARSITRALTLPPLVQLTAQALEIVEGLSGTPEGLASLRPVAATLYKNLLACAKRVQLSRSALTAVVNATQDAPIAHTFVEAGACTRLADYLREGTCGHPDLIIMALSNLTQTDKGAAKLLQVRDSRALRPPLCTTCQLLHSSASAKRRH